MRFCNAIEIMGYICLYAFFKIDISFVDRFVTLLPLCGFLHRPGKCDAEEQRCHRLVQNQRQAGTVRQQYQRPFFICRDQIGWRHFRDL